MRRDLWSEDKQALRVLTIDNVKAALDLPGKKWWTVGELAEECRQRRCGADHPITGRSFSTVGQNDAGQHQEIERWLAGNGIDAAHVRWYLDKATGDNLDRPGFEQLQADIFQGEIGTVVIWRLDRLSRTIRDGLNTLCDWCDKSLRIVSVSQQIDFNGTIGKMIASVLFGVAEMEQQTRRERQRAGIEAAKARGVYMGRKSGTTKAKPRRAQQLRESGLKVDEIATAMGISRRTAMRYLSGKR